MRHKYHTQRLLPLALLGSLVIALMGTAGWAIGGAAAAETASACVAPLGQGQEAAAVAYFDTQLNSSRSWYLGSTTSAERACFNSVMSR